MDQALLRKLRSMRLAVQNLAHHSSSLLPTATDPRHHFPTVDWRIENDRAPGSRSSRRTILQRGGLSVVECRGLLSVKDCEMLVRKAESRGFRSVAWEYAKDYRDCERVVVKAPEIAQELWVHVAAILTASELLNARPYGFDADGFWAPCGVNECMRIVRYQEGGHFEAHKDGAFILDDDTRSLFTIQIFLNDDYQGGKTTFFDEEDADAGTAGEPRTPGEPRFSVGVTGRTGTMLLFSHDVRHRGEKVLGRKPKYVLRTDLMFKRVPSDAPAPPNLLTNPDYMRMEALYQRSIEFQKSGDPGASTAAYLEAQEIQTSLTARLRSSLSRLRPVAGSDGSSSAQHQQQPKALPLVAASLEWKLSYDTSVLVFEYLSLRDLTVCALVCKGWRLVASCPSIWRRLYFRRWPEVAAVENLIGLSPSVMDYMKPWKVAYRQRAFADRNFKVILFDIGSETTRFGMVGEPDVGAASVWSPPPIVPQEFVSIVSRVQGHYWSARSGMEDYLVGPDAVSSYYRTYEEKGVFVRPPSDPAVLRLALNPEDVVGLDRADWRFYLDAYGALNAPTITRDGRAIVNWDALRNICKYTLLRAFGSSQAEIPHPLLFAVPPIFGPSEQRLLEFLVRVHLDTRQVALVSSSVLALLAAGHNTGLVVSSGHLFTFVTPVWRGGPLFEHERPFPYAGCDLNRFLQEADTLEAKVAQLFFPSEGAPNLARVALDAALACPEEMRRELLEHVLLAGGNTFSIEDAFRRELARLASEAALGFQPIVQLPPDRLRAAVDGARAYASFSGVKDLFDSAPRTVDMPPVARSQW